MSPNPLSPAKLMLFLATLTPATVAAQGEFKDVFPDAIGLGEGWHYSQKLGNLWAGEYPWLYIEHQTWWYIQSNEERQFWAFDPQLGWVWSSTETYPGLYSYMDLSWIVSVGGKGESRAFYNYWTEDYQYSGW